MSSVSMVAVHAGELIEYADTCTLGAGDEHRAWMRIWMDRMMAFAAWTQDLRIQVVDDQELEEPVTWSSVRGEYVTLAECRQLGERWTPDLLRVTRQYRVLSGPRGDCPLPDQLPPRTT